MRLSELSHETFLKRCLLEKFDVVLIHQEPKVMHCTFGSI
jgi:hypothetical protein